jgi:hypothetical protein
MPAIWTHGVWKVKPGREDEFVSAWRTMAREAMETFDPPGPPHLFRDRDDPHIFRSFGPWNDAETVRRFRESIKPHLERIQELTDDFDVYALDEIGLDA